MDSDENAICVRADFRTDDTSDKRVSPDSEDIEPAKPSGLKAKLFERGGNPRQSHPGYLCNISGF